MKLPPDFRDLLEEFAREGVEHVVITWDGVAVRVISLDDLIANKRAAGRPQDQVDVVKLERVRAAQRR
jgi:predicted nucleotidyltransferase